MKDIALELSEIVAQWDQLPVGKTSRPNRLHVSLSIASVVIVLGAILGLREWRANDNVKKSTTVPSAPRKMTMRRVTGSGTVLSAALSSDGKYLAYAQWAGNDIEVRVRQVDTGSEIVVVKETLMDLLGLTFSRDGNHVYYVARTNKDVARVLNKVPVLGGAPSRVLVDIESRPGFSPDGSRFCFTRHVGEKPAIFVANTDGSSVRPLILARGPTAEHRGGAWSPDGRFIAAARHDTQIVLIDVATGRTKPLGPEFWTIRHLDWLADGRGILAVGAPLNARQSDRLWLVGYPDGQVRQVTDDITSYSGLGGTTADGRSVAVTRLSRPRNLWIAQPGNLSSGRQITTGDGMAVLWLHSTLKQLYFTGIEPEGFTLWKANHDGTDLKRLGDLKGIAPVVPDDERFVAFLAEDEYGMHINRAEIDGSKRRRFSQALGWNYLLALSPDGRTLLFRSEAGSLMKMPSDGGTPEVVVRNHLNGGSFSPDGKWIATIVGVEQAQGPPSAMLAVVPSAGGEPAIILDDWFFAAFPILCWRGSEIVYAKRIDGVVNLWSSSIDGREQKQLTHYPPGGDIYSFDFAPDGTLFMSRGQNLSDVVVITDFDNEPTPFVRQNEHD